MPEDRIRIPRTIKRSETHAQHIWRKAHDSAVETYGEGASAHRVAYAALKHEYKKEGDHWVKKEEKGPSDPQAARGPTTERKSTDEPRARTAGGAVAGEDRPKSELLGEAKKAGVSGYSKMNKEQLAQAIHKANAKK